MNCNEQEHDKVLNNFCNWIKKVGVKVSAKVRIGKEGSCDRYGMVATSNIEQDEVLFTIPKYVYQNIFQLYSFRIFLTKIFC